MFEAWFLIGHQLFGDSVRYPYIFQELLTQTKPTVLNLLSMVLDEYVVYEFAIIFNFNPTESVLTSVAAYILMIHPRGIDPLNCEC